MDLAKRITKDALKLGACKEWTDKLRLCGNDRVAMANIYLQTLEFCLANDFPSNDFIKREFQGVHDEKGVFVDNTNLHIMNFRKVVTLGKSTGNVEITGFHTSEIYVKHQSDITIRATGNAFLMVDVFDDAHVHIECRDNAKVCVNHFSGDIETIGRDDSAAIKIIEKQLKSNEDD